MEDLPARKAVGLWKSEIPLLSCRSCGGSFGAASQLEILKNRDPLTRLYLEKCPNCREKELAEVMVKKGGELFGDREVGAIAPGR
jgi:hypothetical protein